MIGDFFHGQRSVRSVSVSSILVALVVVYAIFSAILLRYLSPLGAASDFRIMLSTALLVRDGRVGEMYDLASQMAVQESLLPLERVLLLTPSPWVYLPVFVVPVLPLTLFPPAAALVLWALVNVALSLLIFRRLAQTLRLRIVPLSLFALTFFPLFHTIYLGQANIFILLGFTEFYLALRNGRERSAGLWLSMLLIKPQLLPLLLLVLAWKRRWRVLRTFSMAAVLLVGASIVLVQGSGLGALRDLLQSYTSVPGGPNTTAELMANWRAVGLVWIQPVSAIAALVFTAIASGLTALLALLPWRGWQWEQMAPERFDVLMCGLVAATMLSAYHSHLHAVLPLLVPVLFVYASDEATQMLPRWALDVFLLGPSVTFAVELLVALAQLFPRLASLSLPPSFIAAYFALFVTGQATVLFLLLVVLVVAFQRTRRAPSASPVLAHA